MGTNIILKLAFLMMAVSMQLSAVSAENLTSSTGNNTGLAATAKAFLGTYNDIAQSIIISIVLSVILVVFAFLIILLIYKLFRQRHQISEDDGISVYPFENVNSEDKYNGKAIQMMLIAELQRISYVFQSKIYNEIYNSSLNWAHKDGSINIKTIREGDENQNMPQIGTIGVGSSSISIGEFITTIKTLCRNDSGQKIKGSFEKNGSNIKLIAWISGNEGDHWEIKKNNINSILDLARDLAYEFFYYLNADQVLKSMTKIDNISMGLEEFKNITEAMLAYEKYTKTKESEYLQLAGDKCLEAASIEPERCMTNFFLYILGDEYYANKKYNESIKMLKKVIHLNLMKDNPFVWNSLGKAYKQLGSEEHDARESVEHYKKAKDSFNKAIEYHPGYEKSFRDKAENLRRIGKEEEARDAESLAYFNVPSEFVKNRDDAESDLSKLNGVNRA